VATGTFTNASLSGTSVVRVEALDHTLAGAFYSDVTLGIYTFTGTGTVRLAADENAGGAPTTVALSGSYAVSPNGRVQTSFATGIGGCANCVGGGQTYFYLVGPNQGFVMDFTTAAASGNFEPQTGVTPYAASSFSGIYGGGTQLPLTQSASYLAASFNANGSATVSGTEDLNTAGTLTPDLAIAAADTVAASGRAALTGFGSGNAVLYVVSPTKAVALDLGAGSPVVVELVHQ
jgi:hypothetical protein